MQVTSGSEDHIKGMNLNKFYINPFFNEIRLDLQLKMFKTCPES
jgi:hypothetical protein